MQMNTAQLTTAQTNMLNKVPAVTLIFWIIKIMATTVGETAADFLAFNLKLGLPASLGDLLTQVRKDGGLGISTTLISSIFLVAILLLVGFLTRQQMEEDLVAAQRGK